MTMFFCSTVLHEYSTNLSSFTTLVFLVLSFHDGVNASSNIALKAISDLLRWNKFVTTMANFRRRIFDENWNASYFFFVVIIQISIANDATNSSCKDNKLIEKKQTTF